MCKGATNLHGCLRTCMKGEFEGCLLPKFGVHEVGGVVDGELDIHLGVVDEVAMSEVGETHGG